jgi:hypothetical protein
MQTPNSRVLNLVLPALAASALFFVAPAPAQQTFNLQ